MAEDNVVIVNEQLLDDIDQAGTYLDQAVTRTKALVASYVDNFRKGRSLELQSKIVILVDDGIATGETMRAAIKWVTSRDSLAQPKSLIVAVPVCAARTAAAIEQGVDKLICLTRPRQFYAVGQFYDNFEQVSDKTVISILGNETQPQHI